jgi:hypothetical protein
VRACMVARAVGQVSFFFLTTWARLVKAVPRKQRYGLQAERDGFNFILWPFCMGVLCSFLAGDDAGLVS